MKYVDTHCHLNSETLEGGTAEEQLREALEASVERIIVVGFDLDSSRVAVDMADGRNVWATAGLHPHDAKFADDEYYGHLEALFSSKVVVAVGEIGLDYWYDNSPRTTQVMVFARQAEMSAAAGLPVVLHLRDGEGPEDGVYDEAFDVLRSTGVSEGVFHCFGGNMEQARTALDMGFYISFSGVITYPKSAELREIAKLVPQDRILAETDAPYLAPQGHRGKPNRPALVKRVYETLAQVRGVTEEEICAEVWNNASALFRLP